MISLHYIHKIFLNKTNISLQEKTHFKLLKVFILHSFASLRCQNKEVWRNISLTNLLIGHSI